MNNMKCLYCYEPLTKEDPEDFHSACSKVFFGTEIPPKLDFTMQKMAELAKLVVERSVAVPGVQPKISLSLVNQAVEKGRGGRFNVVGALDGNFILKPPTKDYPQMPENESVTMRMAEAFGIRAVPSSLIRLKSGELAYITKRIDRKENGDKNHMLDMFQITEASDKYISTMERVGKSVKSFSNNTLLDLVGLFELTVFSFLTGNNDMHLKNFSMINFDEDRWVLAPAYDLLNVAIANPTDKEELALKLEGRKIKLKKEHFINWGQNMGLNKKQVDGVFSRFGQNLSLAVKWIDNSFLSDEFKEQYKQLLKKRYARFVTAR